MQFASRSTAKNALVCEDCNCARAPGEDGWIRIWLEERHQPSIMLIYCPDCAEQFDAYLDEVSPILGE